jgi:hypothetical protein
MDAFPQSPSLYSPGKNEGIVKSGLIILEMNKELYPDSYSMIRSDVQKELLYVQEHRDNNREVIYNLAENLYLVLKALSGKSNWGGD